MKFVIAAILPAVLFVANANNNPVDIGHSFYLPEKDIYDPLIGGVNIFKHFDDSCYKSEKEQVTVDDRATFEDTNSFYHKISSDSKLSGKLSGQYTMGTTLDVKTESLSYGTVDIKGTSIDVHTYVKASYLDQECFTNSKSQLTDDVINMFDSLESDITNPWLSGSWQHYETFLKTFGTHFVTKTHHGALVRQWTFSKASSQYTEEQLKVRACVDFAGPTEVGKLDVSACSGVTKEDADSVTNLETTAYMETRGGSDETRNQFRSSRSEEDLNKILNEGRAMQAPVSYEYMAIWDILMMKFYDDTTRFAKAMNLKHYYEGYKDFGCSYQSTGDIKLRTFIYSPDSTQELPKFQCTLINRGCHTDDDCHIGGVGSLMYTYCHGNSCYDYKDPEFGSKAQSVVTRTEESGSTYEGVNQSCHYKDAFSAYCMLNFFQKSVIWDSEETVRLASNRQVLYASQAGKRESDYTRVRHEL